MDFIDIALYAGYALVLICAFFAIVLPLINAIGDPKTLVKSGIGLLFIVVVFIIGYSIASGEITTDYQKYGVDAGSSKLVGGGIITMYLLVVIAVVGIVYTEISKLFQ